MRAGGPLLLSCAVLAACAGPRPPPLPAPPPANPAWRTDLGPGQAVRPDWWTGFGDPVLDGLVAQALAANRDVLTADARIREFQAQERIAHAAQLPTLGLGASAVRARELDPFLEPVTVTDIEPALQARYEVDLWRRLADLTGAARANLAASTAARDTTALTVAGSVASGYFTLRGLDERLAIARDVLLSREEALRVAQRRFADGYSSRLELAQAQSERQSAAQVIPQLQLGISRQEDALRVLLGENPGAIPRGAALEATGRPPVPATLPSQLLRARPDIRQSEEQLVAADQNLAAARAALLPTVQLQASAGGSFISLVGLTNPVFIWSFGGSILAPIFEGGRLHAGVRLADARREEALYGYQKTVLAAFAEVEDAMAGVQRLDQQAAEIDRQRLALTEALRVAQNRYHEGYAAYLDVLDAQRNLFNAELSLEQVRADALAARVTLYRTVGGGWTGPAGNP